MGDLLVCERSGEGLSWSPPAPPLQADTMRELMVVEDVLLESTFLELLPSEGSSCRLIGGQLKPTDKAMATHSARTSSSEEDAEEESRSTDEEDRLLTKRCIERQWKNLFESEKTSRVISSQTVNHEYQRRDQKLAQSVNFQLTGLGQRPGSQTVTSIFPAKTNQSHDGPRRSRSFGISVSHRLEERRHQTIKKPQHCRGAVGTSTRAVARPQKPPHRLRR